MISQRPEDAFIYLLRSIYHNAQHSALRLVARRPAFPSKPSSPARLLSTSSHHPLSHSTPRLRPPIGREICCLSPKATSRARRQSYATGHPDGPKPTDGTNSTQPREIAVIGAGITGLTAAHYLARYAENARITIYEASDRPGGWINADRVEVEDDEGHRGHVVFHSGPRMLRSGRSSTKYDDLVLFDVLASLNLDDKVRHPQAVSGNRYLYYPDHLVKLPSRELSMDNLVGTIQSFLTEPIWSGTLPALWNYYISYNKTLNPSYRHLPRSSAENLEDESVAQFLTRILKDDRVVKNIVSGIMHGIYGGDINKLSAKHTMLSDLWHYFDRPLIPSTGLSWVHSKEHYLLADMLSGPNRLKIIELAETAVDWNLFAFEDGLISLVNGLADDLKTKSNVTFRYGEPITSLKHEDGKILVTTPNTKQPAKYDHVICTLFSKQLAQITQPANSLPSLAETHAVTIMVVNLWYPNPNLLTEHGFGYLIPSTTPDNHEGVLGVLFHSDLQTDDSEMPGTKLTVMLGGHHWDGWEHLPSEELAISMAKEAVRRQLGISETEKVVARARLCRDCLPQHFVGHRKRMAGAHYELTSAFQGHLTVAGPSYTTVGVIPAMRAGFDAGMRVARGHAQPWFQVPQNADTKNGALPEFDYWKSELEYYGDVEDVIGASGLEQFTEQESVHMRPAARSRTLFRTFTGNEFRFRDEDGFYIDPDQRVYRNAPRGFKPKIFYEVKD
ncbi:Protoporphyrinogen oxidase [Nemania abortiva]|nr:Protoporphyrinogen oxidase [Nemania abortiva]